MNYDTGFEELDSYLDEYLTSDLDRNTNGDLVISDQPNQYNEIRSFGADTTINVAGQEVATPVYTAEGNLIQKTVAWVQQNPLLAAAIVVGGYLAYKQLKKKR